MLLEDYSCSVDPDNKLNALDGYPILRVHRRKFEDVNAIEHMAFQSTNSSIRLFGTTVSPLNAVN